LGIALDQGTAAVQGLVADVRSGPDIEAGRSLDEKVAFLSQAAAYPSGVGPVARRETHMSWVFFVDGAVYKLKKPVRFAYLDFSTLPRREAACRAEFALNQRLAPDVYDGVAPLVWSEAGLRLGGPGKVVDWLVLMRRLDETHTLEARLLARNWTDGQLDSLAAALARFYRHAGRVRLTPAVHVARWRSALVENGRVLLDPRLGLPSGLVRGLLATQWRFLRRRRGLLAARSRRLVDGHGDLRPEHIWVGSAVKMIDRLEFSATLRAVDPLDELAFLDLECERLGAPQAGARLRRRLLAGLHEPASPELYLFYRIYRALLRARLSIAHLLEPDPRTPGKWPRQARSYLALAARDARRLDRRL
jgi:aminoglycoside phosphotransferase family enzyme